MFDAAVTSGFENVDNTDQFALHVGARILQRIAHARLCRQIHHPLGLERGKRMIDRGLVGEVGPLVGVIRVIGKACQPGLFQRWVLVVVVVFKAMDHIATRQQTLRQGGADEAGSAGNQNAHKLHLGIRVIVSPKAHGDGTCGDDGHGIWAKLSPPRIPDRQGGPRVAPAECVTWQLLATSADIHDALVFPEKGVRPFLLFREWFP